MLGAGIEALRIVAILASPAMPAATGEVWRRLGLPGAPEDQRLPEAAAWGGYYFCGSCQTSSSLIPSGS